MAKFRNGNLVLTSSQKVIIGDVELIRNSEGLFESNVSFAAPDSTSSNTLATRGYVDSVAGGGGGGGVFTEDANQNIFGGTNAGSSITTGSYNFLVGNSAGSSLEDANENIFLGRNAGRDTVGGVSVSGDWNIAIGSYALRQNVEGIGSIAIGFQAGLYSNNDINNASDIFIGYNSGQYYGGGGSGGDGGNVVLGYEAGKGVGDGVPPFASYTECVFIGKNAGRRIKEGSRNVIIGHDAGAGSSTDTTSSNLLIISNSQTENLIEGDFSAKTLHINGALSADSGLAFTEDADDNIYGGDNAGASLTTGSDNFFVGGSAGNGMETGSQNIAIGDQSLLNEESGSQNIAIGYRALYGNAASTFGAAANIGIGANAIYSVDTANSLIAIGNDALRVLTDSDDCVAIGVSAGRDVTAQTTPSVFIGRDAGRYLESGSGANVIIGTQAGRGDSSNPVTYDQSVYVGNQAGISIETGDQNTGVGYQAMFWNETGQYNVCIGWRAGYGTGGNSNHSYNTFVGTQCGEDVTTGTFNVGFGRTALNDITSGQYNTAIGSSALGFTTTGAENVAVGASAGRYINGQYNIIIGYQAVDEFLEDDVDQNVVIGALSDFGSDSTANNRIGLGYGVSVDADNKAVIGNSSVTTIGGFATWTDYSDRSIKTNIQDNDIGIEFIRRLRTRRFEKKDQLGKMHDGLIAQEVKEVMDELGVDFSGWVEPGSNGLQMLSYPTFVIPLINAVTTQQEEIESLRSEVDELKRQLSEVIGQLKK